MSPSRAFLRAAITFGAILDEAFELSQDANVCILVQQGHEEVAEACQHAAGPRGITVKRTVFPKHDLLKKDVPSLRHWTSYCSQYDATFLITEWSPETTNCRLRSLRAMSDQPGCRGVASMPGASIDLLAHTKHDLTRITKNALTQFAILLPVRWCFLITDDPTGVRDPGVLSIPLDRNFVPIISTGKISPGMWGNCPSGETFALPEAYKAHGDLFLDGSLPGRPFGNGEWCHLHFEKGRIRSPIAASSGELRAYANSLFFTHRGRTLHKNANTLAEFGIGANPGISKLTGIPLFDEKKLGTVHLGIGSNRQFHGPIESPIHHDIVCLRPRLVVDRYVVLADGKFLAPARASYRPVGSFAPVGMDAGRLRLGTIPLNETISPASADHVIDPKGVGRWFTTHSTTRGPRVHHQVVAERDTEAVRLILARLNSAPRAGVGIGSLRKHLRSKLSESKLCQIAAGLLAHRIVEAVK